MHQTKHQNAENHGTMPHTGSDVTYIIGSEVMHKTGNDVINRTGSSHNQYNASTGSNELLMLSAADVKGTQASSSLNFSPIVTIVVVFLCSVTILLQHIIYK